MTELLTQFSALLPTLVFYIFACVVLFSAVMVISSKNSVHSVLFLILAFFNAAGLFVLIGAEFIAMSIPLMIVTVYFARLIADAFRRTKWVERALNWSFAAIFTAFAATILTAQARH